MQLYKIENIHFYHDYGRSNEWVFIGLCFMATGRGSVGIHVALLGFRLSIHFNTQDGIEAKARDWNESKNKLNEIVGKEVLSSED